MERRFSNSLPFTLLSDPELVAIKAYGVWQEKKLYGKVSFGVVRTTFIIDENGIVTIMVYTGTYNGVPKYAFYYIPKDILGSVKLCGLIKFLVDRVGQDYKVKNKL